MLVEFKVKNFRSIMNEMHLSMVMGSGKELANTHTFTPLETSKSLELVRSAAIYGPNAAGKSNILKAIRAMKEIVLESAKMQRGDKLPIVPFKLDPATRKEPTEFEVTFISEDVRYQYGFVADEERVYEEWLIAFPFGRPQNWFARAYNQDGSTPSYQWQFGDNFTGSKNVWQKATRDNALFLSTAVQLNSDKLKPVYDWFAEHLRIASIRGWDQSFTVELCKDKEYKPKILSFLKTADIDIDDIHVEDIDFDPNDLPDDMPESIKQEISKEFKGKKLTEANSVHLDIEGKPVEFDLDDESDGTRKLLSFIGPWIDSLESGNVLLIDELHDNFHPMMVRFLIDLFHNNETNTGNAQLVFTTHETSVLSQDVFRRDQIWFCEKKNKASTLFPLTDFSPRKGVEDLEKSYFSGRYGALPYFKDVRKAMGL